MRKRISRKRKSSKRRSKKFSAGYVLYPSSAELQAAEDNILQSNYADTYRQMPAFVKDTWKSKEAAELFGPSRQSAAIAMQNYLSTLGTSVGAAGNYVGSSLGSAANYVGSSLGTAANYVGSAANNTASSLRSANNYVGSAVSNYKNQVKQNYSNMNSMEGTKKFQQSLCESPVRGARAMSIRYKTLPFENNFDCSYLTPSQKALYNDWRNTVVNTGKCNNIQICP